MLDDTMAYSSALFKGPEDTLKAAQLNKFKRLAEKLQLSERDHLLEIGSGWGGFAIFAAENYGCKITTVTISKNQYDYCLELTRAKGLENQVTVLLQDYRDIEGSYDKIVSIEMVEALGYKYFDTFFKKCASLLKSTGIMAIQAITFPEPYYSDYLKSTDWTQKYIFPGSLLLSVREIMQSLDRTSDLMIWDIESMGTHYAKTLEAWRLNVESNESAISNLGFDEAFFRKWYYYLKYCQAGFANRYINVMQLVFSRPLNRNLVNFNPG